MFRVTDNDDLTVIREPLEAYRKASSAYIEWLDHSTEVFPFEADSAHVLNKVKGKDLYHVRRIARSPGRDTLTVPGLRLSSSATIPMLDTSFASGEGLKSVLHQLPGVLGGQLANLVEVNVLMCLLSSAEARDKILRGKPEDARRLTEEAVAEANRACTVICHWNNARHILTSPRLTYEIGYFGTVVPSTPIAENIVLVVANSPQEVGFVRVDNDPEVFVTIEKVCDVMPTAVSKHGFCVWDKAPVTKIDLRSDAKA